ncbi:MAG: SpoIIE family protein phosphatase, partial [Oligoflexia bacterium]|nr:SpoIIE family protein phosphatase [Oligoflexia bacterium]
NPSPQNDANNDGKPDETPQLMDPYLDAGEALKIALKDRRTTVDDVPYSDRWGTFYSAYVPFFDKKGQFVGTLGMDLELTNFENRISPINRATLIAIIIGSILSILCGLQVWAFRRNQAKYASTLAEINSELAHSNEIIKKELTEAENYIKSLFPPAIGSIFPPAIGIRPIYSDWIYQSCSELGGDIFGYHWIDDDNFAIYLVDVCGHGVGAALHSVAVISSIRNMILPNVDFKAPSEVLYSLNNTFNMEKYNDTYFTIWYGIFNKKENVLKYSSGGHPPAMLINGLDQSSAKIISLSTPGMMIGCAQDIKFQTESISLNRYNRLYVFSDGVYEINYSDGKGMMTLETFCEELARPVIAGERKVKKMLEFAQKAQNSENFVDDFTLVEIMFHVE